MLVSALRRLHKIIPDKVYYAIKNTIVFLDHKIRKSILVIGDSHTGFFIFNGDRTWRNPDKVQEELHFSVLPQGPALAYNLSNYGTSTKAREKVESLCKSLYVSKRRQEVFLCCFGEIDCRVHVLKQAEKIPGNGYKKVVDNIITNYLSFLKWLMDYGNVWCWGPVASQSEKTPIDPSFPRYGSEYDRNRVTAYFNEQLKKVCEENGIGFISVFPKLIDNEGLTKEEYYLDGVHLNQKAAALANDQLKFLYDKIHKKDR